MKIKYYLWVGMIICSMRLLAQTMDTVDFADSSQTPTPVTNQDSAAAMPIDTLPPSDAAYLDLTTKERTCIPYTIMRDADVAFRQRIWRVIDLREKSNFHLYYPLEPQSDYQSLFDLLKKHIEDGSINAYKAELGPNQLDDKFTVKLEKTDLPKTFLLLEGDIETDANGKELLDAAGQVIRDDKPLLAEHIAYYKIKEDWIFDAKRSRMEARIIGLAPMKPLFDPLDKKKIVGYTEVFWVFFPDIRPILCVNNAINPKNSSQRRSFDDIFHKRLFTSLIVKTDYDNPYNRNIAAYKNGLDALLEAEKIKKNIFNLEHDIWEY